jgi:hypothetical protein
MRADQTAGARAEPMSVPDPVLSKLFEDCLQNVYRHAFLFAGEPDEAVEATMAIMREQLEETVPVEMVDSLFNAIRRCWATIQNGAPMSVRRH